MDKLGPMCRTADDCGLVLSVLSGHDPRDHQSLRAELSTFHYRGESAKPLRIGRITNAWDKIPDDLQPLLIESEQGLRQHGATIVDVELPEGPYEQAAELTILMEAAASFQELIESGRCAQLDDPLGKINGYVSMQFTAREYLQVQRVRTILQKKVDALFDHVDVLMSTSLPEEAGPLKAPPETPKDTDEHPEPKKKESIPPDGVSSLCGLPAVTVPCGLSKNKLPYGVQFVARALRDDLAIAAANLFQANTRFHRLRPPIPTRK
jgi:aspartyl-tRNA(Asn)/glutamyl-tRNA(Gln) amidotransferase subunit A